VVTSVSLAAAVGLAGPAPAASYSGEIIASGLPPAVSVSELAFAARCNDQTFMNSPLNGYDAKFFAVQPADWGHVLQVTSVTVTVGSASSNVFPGNLSLKFYNGSCAGMAMSGGRIPSGAVWLGVLSPAGTAKVSFTLTAN
jgi:hypothetical protein